MLQAQKYMILYLHQSHYRAHTSTKNNYVYIYLFSFSLSCFLCMYINPQMYTKYFHEIIKYLRLYISWCHSIWERKQQKYYTNSSPGAKLAQVSIMKGMWVISIQTHKYISFINMHIPMIQNIQILMYLLWTLNLIILYTIFWRMSSSFI